MNLAPFIPAAGGGGAQARSAPKCGLVSLAASHLLRNNNSHSRAFALPSRTTLTPRPPCRQGNVQRGVALRPPFLPLLPPGAAASAAASLFSSQDGSIREYQPLRKRDLPHDDVPNLEAASHWAVLNPAVWHNAPQRRTESGSTKSTTL